MSIIYCENCDKYIDTDFDAEHFEECDDREDCKMGPDCKCDDCKEYTANFNPKN